MHIPSILDLPPTCGLAPYSHTPDDRGTGCLQVVQPLGEKTMYVTQYMLPGSCVVVCMA